MRDIDKQIDQRINAFVVELTTLVRQAAIEAVAATLGGGSGRSGGGSFKLTPSARVRRSSEEIAESVAAVLAFIKANPNKPSEAIRKELKMPRGIVRDSLDRLMASKKIKMKGEKRAATYT